MTIKLDCNLENYINLENIVPPHSLLLAVWLDKKQYFISRIIESSTDQESKLDNSKYSKQYIFVINSKGCLVIKSKEKLIQKFKRFEDLIEKNTSLVKKCLVFSANETSQKVTQLINESETLSRIKQRTEDSSTNNSSTNKSEGGHYYLSELFRTNLFGTKSEDGHIRRCVTYYHPKVPSLPTYTTEKSMIRNIKG